MPDEIAVQNLHVERGSKKFGYIEVIEMPSSTMQMPIMVVNGDSEGPTLSLTAGVHGTEYTGPLALGRLFKALEPKTLRGAVIATPVVNLPAFDNRVPVVCPVDNQNLNRIFPGRQDGTVGFRLAHAAFSNVVSKGDYYIDLHGGEIGEEHLDVAYFSRVGKSDLDRRSESLARNCLLQWIWERSPPREGTTVASALERGIPAITCEVGDLATLEESRVKLAYDGLVNILRYLGMLPGPFVERKTRDLEKQMMQRALHSGLFLPRIRQGDIVSKDQLLGEVFSISGDLLQRITSPTEGVVRQTFPIGVVYPGASLVDVCSLKRS